MRLIIFILVLLVLWSCGNTSKPKYTPSKPDTTFILKTFVAFPAKDVKYDAIYRITKDTSGFIAFDSVTKIMRQYRDTTYYIPVPVFVGSTKKMKVVYQPTVKGSVYEGEDVLKAVNELRKWIEANKQYWPDTAKPKTK